MVEPEKYGCIFETTHVFYVGFFSGYIIFAIGFADADYGELVNIASKPSDRHVFFVDDLDAVKKIEEQLITFVCEAATASESPSCSLLAASQCLD